MSSSRVKSLARLYGTKNTSSLRSSHTNDWIIRPSLGLFNLFYYVQVGIGTFDQNPRYKTYYLGFDTGSDLSWTQCEGCGQNCFHQVDPLFPATQSQSYKPFPCQHCPSSAQCLNNGCRLQRTYSNDSIVVAMAARETFTFQSDGDKYVAVFNVIFGCGINMKNFKEGLVGDNMISGLLGMGYGDFSFWGQVENVSKGRFSYCLKLPSLLASGASMYLRFGDDVIQPSRMQSTPLQRFQDRATYYLTLLGISVANRRLAIDPTVFQLAANGRGGCVIDTVAATSYVVSEAYQVLLTAVSNYIEAHNHNVRKMAEPELGLSLCYERFTGPDNVHLPNIIFHFANNADLFIQPIASFVISHTSRSGHGMICFMILESTQSEHNGVTYLGAYQQMNQRIIYDNQNGQLLFGPADCSMSN